MGRGRPSSYTDEIAEEICERLAKGETLNQICRSEGMPAAHSVRRWVLDDVEGFSPRYARARAMQIEHFEDEILALGDGVLGTENNAAVSAAKHAADNRKWLMSKLRPDKYGERIAHTGADGKDLIPAQNEAQTTAAALLLLVRGGLPKPSDE